MDHRIWEAEQVKELLKHPGMAIIREKILAHRQLLFGQWWKGSAEQMAAARDNARGLEAFYNFCKQTILMGKVAEKEAASLPPEKE